MIAMPTYSYMCENCGYEFEQFQSITAKPIRICPKCGRRGLKRLIGAGSGVIFKGSGFYQTDYRSESYKQAEKNENNTTDSSAGEKQTATKTEDSKPGEKTKPDTKKKSA
jgi:putative FmdB family regulatory protein